jgi:hypothetical protein
MRKHIGSESDIRCGWTREGDSRSAMGASIFCALSKRQGPFAPRRKRLAGRTGTYSHISTMPTLF